LLDDRPPPIKPKPSASLVCLSSLQDNQKSTFSLNTQGHSDSEILEEMTTYSQSSLYKTKLKNIGSQQALFAQSPREGNSQISLSHSSASIRIDKDSPYGSKESQKSLVLIDRDPMSQQSLHSVMSQQSLLILPRSNESQSSLTSQSSIYRRKRYQDSQQSIYQFNRPGSSQQSIYQYSQNSLSSHIPSPSQQSVYSPHSIQSINSSQTSTDPRFSNASRASYNVIPTRPDKPAELKAEKRLSVAEQSTPTMLVEKRPSTCNPPLLLERKRSLTENGMLMLERRSSLSSKTGDNGLVVRTYSERERRPSSTKIPVHATIMESIDQLSIASDSTSANPPDPPLRPVKPDFLRTSSVKTASPIPTLNRKGTIF
jgi:hypothetical protein